MAKTRNSYNKIKNFTEKDQVRIKYSYIGKDKKLMLSVYIGEEVYKALTNGQEFKRLKVEYIPNDMVIITPTNNEKEGIVHRYNGKGLFKTTCVRLSLSSYKKLKISKKDFNNRVVSYLFASRSDGKCLNVDLIGDKRKSKSDVVPQDYVSNSKIKPLEISAPVQYPYNCDSHILDYSMGEGCVTHDCLNDVRDTIENRLLDMEERFEKRIKEIESLLKVDKQNNLDIDSLKQVVDKTNDVMNFRFSKIEQAIGELDIKNSDIKSKLTIILSLILSEKSHEDKSIFSKIFGKD